MIKSESSERFLIKEANKLLGQKEIVGQIRKLTTNLISSGICEAQNFPSTKSYPDGIFEIGVSHSDNSIFLKSIPYSEMYRLALETKSFNLKMIDGALISLLYRFQGDRLIAHRLSFFPAPMLESFQNYPSLYLEDALYADITGKTNFAVPLRFDYDIDNDVCKPVEHPVSHFTIGQYKNCRIPVSSAITPNQFITFVVANFYNSSQYRFNLSPFADKTCFEESMFEEERSMIHLRTPVS